MGQGDEGEKPGISPTAPCLLIPKRTFVSVEHPCVIKNIDNALLTINVNTTLTKLVTTSQDDFSIPLVLRPTDPTCRPIYSQKVKVQSVILKITLPKKTGRRRRKGTNDAFHDDPTTQPQDSSQVESSELRSHSRLDNPHGILQSLRDNIGNYAVEIVGSVGQTHRFRDLSDFQYSSTHSPFMNKLKSTVLKYDYNGIKEFGFDPSMGVKRNEELFPPPTLTNQIIPFNYFYRQNPAIKISLDSTGQQTIVNTSAAIRILTPFIIFDAEGVPSCPPPLLPPIETLDPFLQKIILELKGLFEIRPIWTRRAIGNHLTDRNFIHKLKYGFQYVGYMFRSGPWRDAVIKFGVDPRSDPKYRIYQTLFYKIVEGEIPSRAGGRQQRPGSRVDLTQLPKERPNDPPSHLFDGKSVILDGKVWQVCDITDPLLKELLETSPPREPCDLKFDGWFENGLWSKVRVIMKAKILSIVAGHIPNDSDFAFIINLPNVIDESNRGMSLLPKGSSEAEIALAGEYRARALLGAYRDKALSLWNQDEDANSISSEDEARALDEDTNQTLRQSQEGGLFLMSDSNSGLSDEEDDDMETEDEIESEAGEDIDGGKNEGQVAGETENPDPDDQLMGEVDLGSGDE
ncbi:MAG: tau 95 subunit of transcription factor TFIIIC [Trizodia sp. TS-e1964]|nr:MAG: tau 95 subunit of transcription factor TFIIIC [Trizodia sp. TS-e1964]